MRKIPALAALAVAFVATGCAQSPMREGGYAVDAAWPKPLPNNWTLGQVAGIAVDARDHVWLIHRPKTLIDEEKGAALSPPRAKCCVAAPPASELYIADGYGNKRVIVLDAATGAYKRHWGAYGKAPSDDKLPMYNPQSPQFANPVHCVRLSNDGLVYVCDRANNRVQVFRKDGTFVKQLTFEEKSLGSGSSFDLVFSNDAQQKYFYLADGTNDQLLTVERESGRVLSSFGRPGRYAGQFLVLHNIGIDSKGNLYTSEVGSGKSAHEFRPAN